MKDSCLSGQMAATNSPTELLTVDTKLGTIVVTGCSGLLKNVWYVPGGLHRLCAVTNTGLIGLRSQQESHW